MVAERVPFFQKFEPAPELISLHKGDTLAKIFLPFSDIHWLNEKRHQQLRRSFFLDEKPPKDYLEDEDWLEKDENGKFMPGNITEEIYWAVHLSLPLERLAHIKQLALLAFSTEGERNFYAFANDFVHTRLLHSYVTARILEDILRHNGSPQEYINLGIVSALIHDIATPPYGDPTKELDPEAVSEEVALEKVLARYDIEPLKKFGLTHEAILAVVKNKGTIGKLLDITDKIAYTAVDIYFYAGNFSTKVDHGALNPTIEPIRKILRSDPKWANVYQEIRVAEQGEPYFQNTKRLGRFLELRARMHKALYLNPHCRGRDYMFKMLLEPLYSRHPDSNHPLNSQNLLILTDEEIGRIINHYWQIMENGLPFEFVLGILPDYITTNPSQIEEAARILESRDILPIGAETIRKFDPGTRFLTVDPKDGKIKRYEEVNPKHATHLQRMVEACNRTVVYFWPPDEEIDKIWGPNLKAAISTLARYGRLKNGGKLPHYTVY